VTKSARSVKTAIGPWLRQCRLVFIDGLEM